MNILFLSLGKYWSVYERGIYTDLLREFIKENNHIYILSPIEKRENKKSQVINEENCTIIKVETGNIQKTKLIEKGINTLLIEYQFLKAVKDNLSDVKFDLILYPTPPITFVKVIEYIKKRDNATSYLMLKDIFPQNSLDIGLLSTSGIKGIIYRYFKHKEKKLYEISDYIGCMSNANVDYLVNNNSEINNGIVEILPNSIEIVDNSVDFDERNRIRNKYHIPLNKKVFVYGGNLGKPQGIDFLINSLRSQKNNSSVYFLIVGDGTEYEKILNYILLEKPSNVKLMKRMPKEDYDVMIGACDVGMIFLDYRFTIPNFPSRLLSYMQAKLPVLACTDTSTDIGSIIQEGKFGWWCESSNTDNFSDKIQEILASDLSCYSTNSWNYLNKHYNVLKAYNVIMEHLK